MTRKIVALMLAFGSVSVAQAGAGEWTNVGINGGRVDDVEFIGDGVALATTTGGIYRTTNSGTSWTLVRSMSREPVSFGIAVNRANPDQILVTADAPLRSTNRGVTFTTLQLGNTVNQGLQVAGFSRDGAYAWLVHSDGEVWRSSDGGSTWASLGRVLPATGRYWAIETDAVDRNTLYVGEGNRILASRDAGVSWTPLTAAGFSFLPRASRTTSGVVLGINVQDGYIVGRSIDAGQTWTYPSAPQDFIGLATAANNFAVANDFSARFYTSSDEGVTWTERARLPNSYGRRITVDPANSQRILVATDGGIVGSDDGGLTWSERNSGLADAVAYDLAVARDGSNAVYVATSDLGSIYRRDATTGAFAAVGRNSAPLLGYPGRICCSIAVAPQSGNTLYMLRDGHFGRSLDGGGSWTQLASLPAWYFLALDPQNPQVAYAAGSQSVIGQQPVLKSVNGGITWAPSGAGLPMSVGRVYVDPANSATLYALAYSVNVNPGAVSPVYKSLDGGATWAPTPWTGPTEYSPHALAFEPGRSSTIYLATEFGFYKSVNSGVSWSAQTLGPQDVIVDPQSPSILYAAIRLGGVRRSVDGGNTWTDVVPLTAPSSEFGFPRVALVPGHNAKLLAIRTNGGVYELDVTPQLNLELTPAILTAGTAGSFTLTVRNPGNVTATRVRVSSTLPLAVGTYGVTIGAGACTLNVRDLSCDIGTVAPAASVSLTVSFTPTSAGSSDFAIAAYENLASPGAQTRTLIVQNPPNTPSGGGGGGGGRLDYLLLMLLAWATALRKRSLRSAHARS